MGITLYEHNLIAYKAALNQMEHTKKAAVIHPTGTGKSFLAMTGIRSAFRGGIIIVKQIRTSHSCS